MKRSTALKDDGRIEFSDLKQLPNVGPAIAADLRRLGVSCPQDLRGRDPYALYNQLNRITDKRHDPCLLDVFMAVVRFMGGEPAKPWWMYTTERKRELEKRSSSGSNHPRPAASRPHATDRSSG